MRKRGRPPNSGKSGLSSPGLHKSKKLLLRIPADKKNDLFKFIKEHDLRGLQDTWDAVVVGVIMRRPEVIELVRERRRFWKKKYAEERKSHFSYAEKRPKKVPMYSFKVTMYPEDFVAMKNFLIDENIKQSDLTRVLYLDGMLAGREEILGLVRRNKELELSSRKKAVARITNDEYIERLSVQEQEALLEKITQEFDNNMSRLGAIPREDEVVDFLTQPEEDEEDELDRILEEKMRRRKMVDAKVVNRLTHPRKLKKSP